MENSEKRRSSIITILIVVLLFAIISFILIKVYDVTVENINERQTLYYSNLDEEDMMQYEYEYLDKSLNGIYALGIKGEYVVGIKAKNSYVNIVKIESDKNYEYEYFDKKLYLLEKESGTISLIDLKDISGELKIDTIQLDGNVKSFEVTQDGIYYIKGKKLIEYKDSEKNTIFENITSKNFLIKNDVLYIVRDGDLVAIDSDKNETLIDNNVKEIYYYNYSERDRIVYDTSLDGKNVFKNVYNFYTHNKEQSIKNNTFFVPFGEDKYVYTTENNKNLLVITRSEINKYLYKSEEKIDNISFYKEGVVVLEIGDEIKVIELETEKEINPDNIKSLYNIEYIK